ncbi:MAG: hypothetical protein ACSHW7_02295 [Patiriisocius sp.]|uniref:hypothetical protein n=1 Tax=Patiriisocius sp. TaxID=2822396 RepID=UPI003EF63B4D
MSNNKKMQELAQKLTSTFEEFGFKNANLNEISFSYLQDNDNNSEKFAKFNRAAQCKLVRNPRTGEWDIICN